VRSETKTERRCANEDHGWPGGPTRPALDDALVHVWRAELDAPAHEVERCAAILRADELQRADSFRFRCHRDRFVMARSTLRSILGSYLDVPAREVPITYSATGKPLLARHDAPDLRFNLSHSGNRAVYAVCAKREVGVDIEAFHRNIDDEALSVRFFAEAERRALAVAPRHARRQAFFSCWTRKEAYIKATGRGLATPLEAFAVCPNARTPMPLLWVRGDPSERLRWVLVPLTVAPGYIGALAVEAPYGGLRCWSWIRSRGYVG